MRVIKQSFWLLLSDEDLLAKVVNGNKEAFNHLLKRYQKKLYTFIWTITLNQTLAEDVVQNTFITIWQKPQLFKRNNSAKFVSWLYTIAKNNAIDELRKHTKLTPLDNDYHCQQPQPQHLYEQDKSQQKLYQTLAKLPINTRAVVELYYFENQSYRHIAERLNLSERQVEYKLDGAKKVLKKQLLKE